MKAIKTLTLGLLSAAFLAIGFNKVASALDPLTVASDSHNSRLVNCVPTVSCSLPCMSQNKADRTS